MTEGAGVRAEPFEAIVLDLAWEDVIAVMRYILSVAGPRPFAEIQERIVRAVPAARYPWHRWLHAAVTAESAGDLFGP